MILKQRFPGISVPGWLFCVMATCTSASEPVACDLDAGQRQFRKCAVCHSFDADSQHRIGPNLFGVVGRHIAIAKDFPYTDALLSKDGRWTESELNAFLENPQAWAPGTSMAFGGLANAAARDAVICFLANGESQE